MSQDEQINALFGSESEDDPQEEQVPEAGAGEAEEPGSTAAEDVLKQAGLEDSEDELDAPAQAGTPSERAPRDPLDGADALEDEDEDPQHDRPISAPEAWQVPLISRPPSHVHILNFKALMDIETQPFNADKFDINAGGSDDQGKKHTKASVLNRIRWRFAGTLDPETQQLQKESNARFVRWSDGSLQLLLGDEVLDVSEQSLEDHNMALCAFHPAGRFLQSQCPITSRFAVRPHGINSQLRRNQTAALVPSRAAAPMTREDTVIRDHESLHQVNVAQAESRLRLEARQDKIKRKSTRSSAYSSFSRGALSRGSGLTAEALENGDDYDEYDDDDDNEYARGGDDQDEEEQERRLMAAKQNPGGRARSGKRKTVMDDEDDFMLSDDDPEDMPAPAPPPGKRRFVLDDDDE